MWGREWGRGCHLMSRLASTPASNYLIAHHEICLLDRHRKQWIDSGTPAPIIRDAQLGRSMLDTRGPRNDPLAFRRRGAILSRYLVRLVVCRLGNGARWKLRDPAVERPGSNLAGGAFGKQADTAVLSFLGLAGRCEVGWSHFGDVFAATKHGVDVAYGDDKQTVDVILGSKVVGSEAKPRIVNTARRNELEVNLLTQ